MSGRPFTESLTCFFNLEFCMRQIGMIVFTGVCVCVDGRWVKVWVDGAFGAARRRRRRRRIV